MADTNVEIEFTSRLKELKASLEEATEFALDLCGDVAEGHAKAALTRQKAVDTGRLRNSITHAVVDENGEKAVYVGTNVEYAPYVELGTRNYPKPRPYIEPAATKHTNEYKAIIQQVLSNYK